MKVNSFLIQNSRVFFFLISICYTYSTFSQDSIRNFESLSVSDGLVQSLVVDIIRDQYGYVWFGTFEGLSRYDGYEFINFHHDPYDSNTLSNSTIWKLFEAQNGDIWVGTYGGINKYDRSREYFVRHEHPDLENMVVKEIMQWNSDTLILGTSIGLFFFDTIEESFFRMSQFDSYDKAQEFAFSKSGDLLLVNGSTIHFLKEKESLQMEVGDIKAIHIDENDNIWIVTYTDIRMISSDFSTVKITKAASSASYLAKIAEDRNGQIIIANEEVFVFDQRGTLLERHNHDPNRDFSISGNSAISIEIDIDGTWWIGTAGYGVNKYDPNRFYLGFLNHKPTGTPSIGSSYVTSFFTEDDNRIFIGTAASLDLFNKDQSTVKNIYPKRIDFLLQGNHQLWAASHGQILLIDMDREEVIKEIDLGQAGGSVRSMKIDRHGKIWIASGGGLSRIDPENSNDYLLFIPENQKKKSGPTDWFTSIYELEEGMIIGTTSGLFEIEFSTQAIHKIENPLLEPLSDSFIKCIEEDRDGILWIGTSSEGLFRWDRANNSLAHYTKRDGLPSNVVYGVLQDEKGFLWMSTNLGLARLDDQKKEFLNLDIRYGLQSNEFNTGAYFKSKNGMLYFGGVEGLNYFKPTLVVNNAEPETDITGFYLQNNRVVPEELGIKSGAIMDVDTLVLDYKQNMLSFDFTSSNHTISELNQYAYYLEGLETDWNYVGSRRFANYSALLPGEYVFNVKSSNNSGLWDASPAQMVIIITEPYWQTTWFKALAIAFIATVVSLIVGLRIRGLKKTEDKLNLLVRERTENLQQANEDLKKTMQEKEEAQQRLIQNEKMAALGVLSAGVGHEINNPLNFIKQALVGLEKELSPGGNSDSKKLNMLTSIMHEGVARASQIVKGLSSFSRSGEAFDETCDIESIIDNCIVLLNSKLQGRIAIERKYATNNLCINGNGGKLHQLFFNLINNAEQAMEGKGSIVIETIQDQNELHVIITDSGEGISNENLDKIFDPFFTTKDPGKGTGLGLAIVQTIVKEHKGVLNVASEIQKGSTFKISLPID
ncbi:MAG: two-component regulator propeller domain-containing protein [Ekhidna sp.]